MAKTLRDLTAATVLSKVDISIIGQGNTDKQMSMDILAEFILRLSDQGFKYEDITSTTSVSAIEAQQLLYKGDTTAGAIILTLPFSGPRDSCRVIVSNFIGSNNLTVTYASGVSVILPPDGWVELSYQNEWQIVANNIQLISKVGTGTAPMVVTSTTKVENFNADKLDGYDLNEFLVDITYYRNDYFKATSPSSRTIINTPSVVSVVIDGARYSSIESQALNLDTAGNWDAATYATPANRAGKDFYIYACIPVSGNIPVFILSANSTYPTGYTDSNSRKIGGFHCLCVAVGTACYPFNNSRSDLSVLDNVYITHDFALTDTSRHWLKNYIVGDILPFSIWDLSHRPISSPEGMVYDPTSGKWIDIYLPSHNAGLLQSKYNIAIASGTTSPAYHQYKFSQQFRQQKKMLLNQNEFVGMSLGSPQGQQISTGAMPAGTGGHIAQTSSFRIISNIGVEDATGVFWQWGEGGGAIASAAAYENAYTADDLNVAGQHYQQPTAPFFGGSWGTGVTCGSRGSNWGNSPLGLNANISGRGASLVSIHK